MTTASVRPAMMTPAPHLHLFYGGTFDPIHYGHLAIARAARECCGAAVHFIPAADPPHRPHPGASAPDRCHMLELALAQEPGLLLNSCEIARSQQNRRPSYSVETLEQLRQTWGMRTPFAWLLGADALLGLPSWYRWQDLLQLAHLIIADREEAPATKALPPELASFLARRWVSQVKDLLVVPAGRVLALQQPLYAVSAKKIRAAIALGNPWQHWLPPAVARFIQEQQLYLPHSTDCV